MTILLLFGCIALLIVLISYARLHTFISFLLVSILAALLLGLPATRIAPAIEKGIGDILGGLLILITFGAMFGKIIAESGAAQRIAEVMMRLFGEKNMQWAMVCIGFVIGIPLFYGIGFVLMVPLIFTVVYRYKLPAVYIGLPMLAALSVTHGFLPPHPSPAALVVQFNADMGLTLIYGFALAIPAIILAGPIFSRLLKNMPSEPLATFTAKSLPPEALPGTFNSFFTALLPVLLLLFVTGANMLFGHHPALMTGLSFLGAPSVVLLIAFGYALVTLGLARHTRMDTLMQYCVEALKDVTPILLIIAGSGALKEILTATGVDKEIANLLQDLPVDPLLLGWLMAALIRACVGSATVAGLTTASMVIPLMEHSGTNPNLMVLAIGAGSLAFSHVNDAGFWMFKEYFNLTVKNTFLSWSVMESLVALIGLIGVLIMNYFLT